LFRAAPTLHPLAVDADITSAIMEPQLYFTVAGQCAMLGSDMPAETAHWSELREFAECEPSALTFRALVALLDTWPGDDQAAAIEYAGTFLSEWPDTVRLAPWSWCRAVSRGVVLPTWQLVRALQLVCPHLTKGTVDLARLAHHASLEHITVLKVPFYTPFEEISFLYHRPETFPALKALQANNKYDDGEVRAIAVSPLWRTLETFEIEDLAHSLFHCADASRIVPQLDRQSPMRHLTLRSPDLVAVWDAGDLPRLRSVGVFIRSVEEAEILAARPELSRLTSLSIAFRCGSNRSAPSEPFLGNIIEADEAAANAFFRHARLDRLEKLTLIGYRTGYWGREGLGRGGLNSLIASGLLQHLKHLRLELLPLGDEGVTALAPALGKQLQTLELVDVYCKGDGTAALALSPCLPSLRRLDLSGNRIDAQRFAEMAAVPIPHLQSLDLSGPKTNPYYWNIGQQPLLDAGAAAWANSANAERLKELRLANCHLTDEALIAVFRSSRLRSLETLDLSHNVFTAAAIAQAVVGSPLWQALRELRLDDCRLDDAGLEALTRVSHAPALRSLQLEYNSIGPKGAAALARWPALARVWELGLHDNLIGDDGLIAFAESPFLGRLLELDLEQDVWNSRKFDFHDRAAEALAAAPALARLDSLFSGCVDEYHTTAYSPGFTKEGLRALRAAPGMRPAFKGCCGDFSGVSEYNEGGEFDEGAALKDHDFRSQPFTLNEKEAASDAQRGQQVPYPGLEPQAFDPEKPPEIRPFLAELDFSDDDILEGLEFRDPSPRTDCSARLNLPFEDPQRPLPHTAGKWLSDTLGSIFRTTALGSFETSGGSSRPVGDGRYVYTDASFWVGFKGDPKRALGIICETLWWVGAPADTNLDAFALPLSEPPATIESRFLQLAVPQVERWQFDGEAGHRIDRLPFSTAQREGIRRVLAGFGVEPAQGWTDVATRDGGRLTIYTRYLNDGGEFEALDILVDVLTPEMSGLVHQLMRECALMLLPMAFAAMTDVAESLDCDWPKVEVVESAAALHKVLASGPYHWWRQTEQGSR
jgi:hypothetical protein